MQKDKYLSPEKMIIRVSNYTDEDFLRYWLRDSYTRKWFPCESAEELCRMCEIWVSYFKIKVSLTAVNPKTGDPVGIATLFLNEFARIGHTAELSIIVDPKRQRQGIGKMLIRELESLAKGTFKLDSITLSVYDTNPAIRLYEYFGYKICGRIKDFVLIDGVLKDRILMEKKLT